MDSVQNNDLFVPVPPSKTISDGAGLPGEATPHQGGHRHRREANLVDDGQLQPAAPPLHDCRAKTTPLLRL